MKKKTIMSSKSRWQDSQKKVAAARAMTNLQQIQAANNPNSVTDDQFKRAKTTFIGLFLLLVTVWSTFLVLAIFALRVNLEDCENCPEECQCREAAPAWG